MYPELDRKLSPRYPSVAEALERRRHEREDLARRLLFAFTLLGLLFSIINFPFGMVITGFAGAGYAITSCIVSQRAVRPWTSTVEALERRDHARIAHRMLLASTVCGALYSLVTFDLRVGAIVAGINGTAYLLCSHRRDHR